MKKWFVVLLAILMLVVSVSPALASNPDGGGKKQLRLGNWNIVGTVDGIDHDAGTIDIASLKGNRAVKAMQPQGPVTIQTDENTKIRLACNCAEEGTIITLADVTVGQSIVAGGKVLEDGTLLASRVIVGMDRTTLAE